MSPLTVLGHNRRAPGATGRQNQLPSTEFLVFMIVTIEFLAVNLYYNYNLPICRLHQNDFNNHNNNIASPNVVSHGRNFKNEINDRVVAEVSANKTSYDGPYRIYPPKSLSCGGSSSVESNWKNLQNEPSDKGLLYLNLIHSEDDIVGSVALQIASSSSSCPIRIATTQKTAHQMGYANRQQAKSFLFTFVRSPTERAIRDFFHHMITLRKWEPNDVEFQSFLEERDYGNRNIRELTLQEPPPSFLLLDQIKFANHNNSNNNQQDTSETSTTTFVESILLGYDFIGISERRDESLVVLKLLMGLSRSQILYLENPVPFVLDDERCTWIAEPFVSPDMNAYFQSAAWQRRLQDGGDLLLYRAAQQSLDKTIAQLGQALFAKELKIFRKALEYAKEACQEYSIFQCNLNGMWQRGRHSCILDQYGCANSCLAEVADHVNKM